MRTKRLIKWLSCLALFCMPVFFSFSSCKDSQDIDDAKISIILPKEKTVIAYVGDSGKFTTIFTGFSFESVGNVDYSKLKVKNQFNQPLAVFSSYIVNLDTVNKTFDVQIDGVGVIAQKTNSPLLFTYLDKELETGLDVFSIDLKNDTIVNAPANRILSTTINRGGTTVFLVKGFTYSNMTNLRQNLKIDAEFIQEGATITYEFENINVKQFDIRVSIVNAEIGSLDGKFIFTYRDEPLCKPPLENFSLIINDVGSIITPSQTNAIAPFHNTTTTETVIQNFRYTGNLKPEFLTVSKIYDDEEQSIKNIKTEIINWKTETKSFDVKLTIEINSYTENFPIEKNITLNFFYKTSHLGYSDIKVDFHYAIPKEWLNMNTAISLNGIKDEFLEKISANHRWLDVPNDVSEIRGFDKRIKTPFGLNFVLGGRLQTIDDYAFCTSPGHNITGSLMLPANVQTIGQSAFQRTEITGTLTLPTIANCTIKMYAFESSTFTGELLIPKNIQKVGTAGFSRCSQLEKVRIISSDTEIDQWVFSGCENLSTVDFSTFTTIPSWFKREDGSFAFQDTGEQHFKKTGKKGQIIIPKSGQFRDDLEEFKELLTSNLHFNLDYWEIVNPK